MSSSYRTVNESGLATSASPAEIRRFTQDTETCGMCKHFHQAEGQRRFGPMAETLKKVVREHGWKLYHLGSKPEDLGICGEAESGSNSKEVIGRITGKTHSIYDRGKKCPGFTPRNGAIGGGR